MSARRRSPRPRVRQEGGERAPGPEPQPEDVEAGADPAVEEPLETGFWGTLKSLVRAAPRFLLDLVIATAKDQPYLVLALLWGVVRATGTTVQSGTTGLLFSFGRARREIPPGFRILIPFAQLVIKVPTRARTLDLPAQKVTTRDGLVYIVDANIVFRVRSVREAVVQVDNLLQGMRQMLGLSVQEVLRGSNRRSLMDTHALDEKLKANMRRRVEPWGVELERAGFMSLRPSPVTLQVTQLGQLVRERERALARVRAAGLPLSLALPLIGEGRQVRSRRGLLRAREDLSRRRRRIRRALSEIEHSHPELLRRSKRRLVRWMTRITDSSSEAGVAWARKAFGPRQRAVPQRRYGQPRERR